MAELAPLEAALVASEAARGSAAEADAAQIEKMWSEVEEMRTHCKQASGPRWPNPKPQAQPKAQPSP